jgi:D-3-phosphoglycerate dehydrogenase
MNIAITDWTFPDLEIEERIIKAAGDEVVARQCKTETELIALAADADAVITQFARITPAVIAAMLRSRAIVRYGIGVDNVDLAAAREHGIAVCNVPDYCIDEVADHTLAFILAATRQVVSHTVHLRAGAWSLAVPVAGMKALRDLTVGVVGFGRIGREVVSRLTAFKCRVLVFDPVVTTREIEHAGATPVVSVDALLPQCDVLTLHCPSTDRTRRMIDSAALAKLKLGSILVNVARGDLVDTAAPRRSLAKWSSRCGRARRIRSRAASHRSPIADASKCDRRSAHRVGQSARREEIAWNCRHAGDCGAGRSTPAECCQRRNLASRRQLTTLRSGCPRSARRQFSLPLTRISINPSSQ